MVCVSRPQHLWGLEDNLWEWVLLLHLWVLGIEFKWVVILRDKRQVPFPTELSQPNEIYLCSKNYFIIISCVCVSFTCMYVCHNCDVALEVTRRCWIP